MAQTLFHRVGGFAAVSGIVMDFYDRILDSEKAGDFFDGVDVDKMIDHQTRFISSMMGGPSAHTDEQLRRSHANLKIDGGSFDEMIDILCATLKDHNLDSEDIAIVRREYESRRSLIVVDLG
ncbi:MAG: group 1 truncated hemoglobin [Rhodospirillales bacterium]|nr:group 1 truncated hemoglobin [Rhodospirillales bacterium]